MTDRELLEMAAKAAGYTLGKHSQKDAFTYGGCEWNPLDDDGDAFRLAVKLGLDVCIDTAQEHEAHTHVIGFRFDDSAETSDAIENHGDPYAATRRAIVRVAAEIGKGME